MRDARLSSLHEPQRLVRVEYQERLDGVDDELVGAALLVAEAFPRITRAFLAGDHGCVDDARSMAHEVHESCRHIEDEGFRLLAREAPISGDLRRLVAILRLVWAVERSAALLRHVAEATERFDARFLPHEVRQQVEELAVRSADVFRRGVDAWRLRDGLAINDLDRLDAGVDLLARGLLARAEELVDPAAADLLMLGLLARYLERIADHGVSFAQHGTFAVTGERPPAHR